eukprot:8993396-Karenia_brevis.AAC.1
MGGDSKGRLRFRMQHLDANQCRATPFEEKLYPRASSDKLLTEVLREILVAQQSLAPSEAGPVEQAAGDQPARDQPVEANILPPALPKPR